MFPADEHWDNEVFVNRITVLYYAKVLGFIAEESTSKGGFKLLYAPTFSKSAEDGKQGAALKNFLAVQQPARGFNSSLLQSTFKLLSSFCVWSTFLSLWVSGVFCFGLGFFHGRV